MVLYKYTIKFALKSLRRSQTRTYHHQIRVKFSRFFWRATHRKESDIIFCRRYSISLSNGGILVAVAFLVFDLFRFSSKQLVNNHSLPA